jgi:hypothetical protein
MAEQIEEWSRTFGDVAVGFSSEGEKATMLLFRIREDGAYLFGELFNEAAFAVAGIIKAFDQQVEVIQRAIESLESVRWGVDCPSGVCNACNQCAGKASEVASQLRAALKI